MERSKDDPAAGPQVVDLVPGTYYWCRCGEARGVFCERLHECGLERPLEFRMLQPRQLNLCQCRMTRTPPVCDGCRVRVPKNGCAAASPREKSIFRERVRRARESGRTG